MNHYVRSRRRCPVKRAKPIPVPWAEVARLAEAGLNSRQIIDALALGGTPGTLKHRAALHGIMIRRATKAEVSAACEAERAVWTPERISKLITAWSAGLAIEAIGRDLGMSGATVKRKAQMLGLGSRRAEPIEIVRPRPACLPVPVVAGPVLAAIARLLEAA